MAENPSAFPVNTTNAARPGAYEADPGMTLRDHFAGEVCAAMVSTIRSNDDYRRARQIAHNNGFDGISEWFASDAYKQADAMLAERQKGGA